MLFPTRRGFLKAAAAGVTAPYAFAQSPKIGSTEIGDNLYLLTGAGCNVIVRTGAAGIVMVDGGLAQNAEALAQAVAALPNGGPVRTLFNTHWHPEQTGSNADLGMAGATIIAQENTRLWLQQNITYPWNHQTFKKFPKVAQPNKTFYDKGTLDSGIRYGYIPDAAHTDGDLYVYFQQQNVLAVGDAAYGQGWPVVDWWTGGWIGGIVGGLQRIQSVANRDTKIIPAQGPVLSYADITAQAEMYGTIYDRLYQMLNKGRGPSEGVEAKPAKEFEAKMGNSDEFIRRSFESLWAYLSPDA
ncbi:MAG TPA: MBL fold metallo-hydrolase [Bryobacteraceae bacterium]|jgi:glyoxylase-like metal-dependent hydrolase (beta-lactamase superfamily II)|nr:MBL fold metallo-hydrolase [Bryobacteraceae bacterium]